MPLPRRRRGAGGAALTARRSCALPPARPSAPGTTAPLPANNAQRLRHRCSAPPLRYLLRRPLGCSVYERRCSRRRGMLGVSDVGERAAHHRCRATSFGMNVPGLHYCVSSAPLSQNGMARELRLRSAVGVWRFYRPVASHRRRGAAPRALYSAALKAAFGGGRVADGQAWHITSGCLFSLDIVVLRQRWEGGGWHAPAWRLALWPPRSLQRSGREDFPWFAPNLRTYAAYPHILAEHGFRAARGNLLLKAAAHGCLPHRC